MEQTIFNDQVGHSPAPKKEVNNLFPVFFKLEKLSVLIVGGGYVGHEKLTAVISNSPAAHITIVAISISEEIKKMAQAHSNIHMKFISCNRQVYFTAMCFRRRSNRI